MTPNRSYLVLAGLAALFPSTSVTAQVSWNARIPARASGMTLWATQVDGSIVGFDTGPSGNALVAIDTTRTKLADVTDPRFVSGIAGTTASRDLCVVLHDTTGAQETAEWDGTKWTFYDRRAPNSSQVVVGGHLLSWPGRDPLRLVADRKTGRIEVEDFAFRRWSRRTLFGGPADTTLVMAEYANAKEILVFDGMRGETWLLDVIAQTWTKHGGASPSPRAGAAIALDMARGRVVLHGGLTSVGDAYQTLSETWEWEGRWLRRFANAGAVDQRFGHSMVYPVTYVPGGSRGIIVGGAVASGPRTNPTVTPRDDVRDYGPTVPAWVERFGTTCGLRDLFADAPWFGRVVVVGSNPSTSITLLLAGTSRTRWGVVPLPLTLSRACSLYVSPDWISPQLGTGRWSYVIPADARLLGQTYYHQALDPSSLWTSNALELHIGEL